jgi:ATP-dependent exoDNAse (exonuclease V) alpha subunit
LDWDAEQIKPTLLFSRRFDVDTINDANIRALKPGRTTYTVKTIIEDDAPAHSHVITKGPEFEKYVALYDKAAPYEMELTLAEGAQVMLIYNMDIELGLANGSRGVITGFKAGLPVVLFKNGVEITIGNHSWPLDDYKGICRAQIPLQLAWAQTTHKAQGATLDCASIDIGSNVFEYGQAYVALSRVRSLESLYISSLNPRAIRAHPRVIEYYEGLAG